jgi:AcrR family transcriptional regulator
MGDVNGGTKRSQKAKETRRRIREAAAELFVERGYGATLLQDVADRAGVAVQTIYFTFGNKRTLLKEVADVAIAGDDEPVATMDRPWFHDVLAATSAASHLEALVHGVREILARVAPMAEVLRTAATIDPDLAGLWRHDSDPRYTVHLAAATALVKKPGVRAGMSAAYAADVLFGVLSPELYLLFVRDRGWSPEQWEQWALETVRAQLTPDWRS